MIANWVQRIVPLVLTGVVVFAMSNAAMTPSIAFAIPKPITTQIGDPGDGDEAPGPKKSSAIATSHYRLAAGSRGQTLTQNRHLGILRYAWRSRAFLVAVFSPIH